MSINITYPNQEYFTGDTRALALERYLGEVHTSFEAQLVTQGMVTEYTIDSGSSFQFPLVGGLDHEEHDPGTDIQGSGDPQAGKRNIEVDDKEIISYAFLTKPQMQVSHYDLAPIIGQRTGTAVGREIERRRFIQLAKGARQLARGNAGEFAAGNLINTDPGVSTLAAAFPVSETGSRKVQDLLSRLNQVMDEKNVPVENRVAYIDPYLRRVLREDRSLFNRDFASTADRFSAFGLPDIEGFRIVVSNLLPRTNRTTGETAYQGDFTQTAILASGGNQAVGHLKFGGDEMGMEVQEPLWMPKNRAYMYGASAFGGIGWLRPEYCCEIYFGTEYTAGATEYAPA